MPPQVVLDPATGLPVAAVPTGIVKPAPGTVNPGPMPSRPQDVIAQPQPGVSPTYQRDFHRRARMHQY
jgi:hypothetical protein